MKHRDALYQLLVTTPVTRSTLSNTRACAAGWLVEYGGDAEVSMQQVDFLVDLIDGLEAAR